ncbi:TPA: fimbrial protein [Citrobacter koseri]|nr:fimbrial protein [Citrobacter koseri]
MKVRGMFGAFYIIAGMITIMDLSAAVAATTASESIKIVRRWPASTCRFTNEVQTVLFDDIFANAFKREPIQGLKSFSVGINCGTNVSKVNIVPSGDPDDVDISAFKNIGGASNVALRLMDTNSNILLPDGTSRVSLIPEPVGEETSYTFIAGYVAIKPESVGAGTFTAWVNLTFDYD